MPVEFVKRLRRNMTGPELSLWRELRPLRATGFIIRRQSPFGIYVVDFVSHRERLVIEVDGVTHQTVEQRAHDAERTKFIESRGYFVVRFSNDEVLHSTTNVVNRIKQMLVERRAARFTAMPLHLRAEFPPPEPSRPAGSNVRPPRGGGGIA
jgi:very-short-patch-repair endonuclease